MAIEWNYENMTTGSDEIDEDHKEWIRRFNQFDAAIVNRQGIEAVVEALQYFALYTETHFPHEEQIMEALQSPSAQINKAEHNKFREKLNLIGTWVRSEGATLFEVIELKIELERWLADHIGKIDRQLRSVVNPEALSAIALNSAQLAFNERQSLIEQLNQPALSEQIAEAILQSSPDVILLVDKQGQIVYVKGRTKDLLGYDSKDLLGTSVELLVPEHYERHAQMRVIFQNNPQTKAMGTRPVLSIRHKSGTLIPVDISLSPLPQVGGYGSLTQAVIRDAMPRWSSQQDLLIQSVAMNSAANGIVITDTNGIIQWVNPAVTRMTGYTQSELIGATPRLLKSGMHEAGFYETIWKTVLAGKTWYGEIINRRKDGTLYYEEQHIAPVHNTQGQIVSLIAIKQDVTARHNAETKLQAAHQELRRQLVEIEHLAALLNEANLALESKVKDRTAELALANEQLTRANEQLNELDHLKSSFLSVISHELRTPFASIMLNIKLLETSFLQSADPDQTLLFQQLSANILAANSMINNLVNYAEFVRKQGILNIKSVKLDEILINIQQLFHNQAERKRITLAVEVPADLPIIQADEDRLMNAIFELADNAIKFTAAGGRVVLRCWTADGMIFTAVEDSGKGVPPELLPALWESFSQMADPIRRGREGLGLGLALVKYIVEAHSGEVWAESQQNIGSTFGFRLPITP